MFLQSLLITFFGIANAANPALYRRQGGFFGVATFVDFASEHNTVCGPLAGSNGMWGAAAGDLSPDISGGRCSGTMDFSICSGQQPHGGYLPPECPHNACGKCYEVTNMGGHRGSAVGGQGKSIKIQIIDSCPSTNAWNFCKTDMDPEEKCMSSSINSLDIERNAYYELTGQSPGSGPNLQVSISPTDCTGGAGDSWPSSGQTTSQQSSPDMWNMSAPAQTDQSW